MGAPSIGDVVIIPFPYSDLSQSKRRPALILAEAGRGDFLLCQITSKQYGDLHALSLQESDFLCGGIKRDSSSVAPSCSLPMRLSFLELLDI